MEEDALTALYYACITRFIGCTSTSEDTAAMTLGDELTRYFAFSLADLADPDGVRGELEARAVPDAPQEAREALLRPRCHRARGAAAGGRAVCAGRVPDPPAACADRSDAPWCDAALLAGPQPRDAVRLVLDQTGQSSAGPRVYPDGMTPREAEVLKHLARGKTNNEITRDLDVSPKTVDNHLQNLFRKIGANTRSVAAM